MTDKLRLKVLPRGKADFRTIRERGMAVVDKTQFIELVENCGADYVRIVRPRRFGKSLSVNMLEAYYDEAAAGDFDKVFAGTYIAEHKTALAGAFRVLHLDFSGAASTDVAPVVRFLHKIHSALVEYFGKYPHPQQTKILDEPYSDAASLMEAFFALMGVEYRQKLFVIIDEYDQFPNEILAADLNQFKAITSSRGFLKDFYSCLKAATTKAVARVFITGVTTISLDSMTSGFNIAENVSADPDFAAAIGFTEQELKELILESVNLKLKNWSLDDLVAQMREWYNGYRFSPYSDETVFNSNMCLYYLSRLQKIGRAPENMIDPASGQNLDKIESILALGDSRFVRQTVERALRCEAIPFLGGLRELNLNQSSELDDYGLLSAMFYFGYLTYARGEDPALVIPNRAVSIQFFEYFLKHVMATDRYEFVVQDFVEALRQLAAGNPRPLFEVTCRRFDEASGVHAYGHLQESNFQTLVLGAFNFSDAYDVQSEVEVRGEDKGFVDILAVPKAGSSATTAYLVELKHLKAKEYSAAAVDRLVREAQDQMARYVEGANLKTIQNLKTVTAVFVGMKLEKLVVC